MAADDLNSDSGLDAVLPAGEPKTEPDLSSVLPVDPTASEANLLELLPAPKRPHPNFWWSLLWCFAIFVSVNGTVVAALIAILIGGEMMSRLRGEKEEVSRASPRQDEENDQRNQEEVRAERRALLEATIFEKLTIPILLAEIITTLFALATLRIFLGKSWTRLIALRRPSLIHLVLVLIGLPGMLILPDLVHRFAKEHGIPVFEDPEQMARFLGSWPLWFGVLVVGLGPGLSEELWCRGFLGRGLVGNYGPLWGVLLTSLLFGLLHVDPAHALATAVIGLWLHFVYLMSRSLLIPMLLHALNNSTAVFLAGVQLQLEANEKHPESAVVPNSFCLQIYKPFENLGKLGSDHPWVLLAGSVMLLSGVCWAMYKSRARLVAAPDAVAPWRPDFPGVEYPPPGSATKVYRPWPGWLASGLVLAGILGFAGCIYWAAVQ